MWSLSAAARYFYFAHLSRPATYRAIYRLIRRHRLRRLVEMGVGLADRSQRMIEVAARDGGAGSVFFTGIDLFEARGKKDAPGLPLKAIHRKLAPTGAKIRLLPGDPCGALSRNVNMLGLADLVVVSADQEPSNVARSWWFIDRLLHEGSHVLVEEPASEAGAGLFRPVTRTEVHRLAAADRPRRAA